MKKQLKKSKKAVSRSRFSIKKNQGLTSKPRVISKKKPSAVLVRKIKKILRKKKLPAQKSRVASANHDNPAEHAIADASFKAKIKVIGIGGGGSSIVFDIGRSLGKASFVVADTDSRNFKKRKGIKSFLFGQELTHGLGTGLNIDLARRAAEAEKERIAKLLEGQDIVIFIASLGGGLGSAATKVFVEALQTSGAISLGIFTLPFKFEGKQKYSIALRALRDLQSLLNVSIVIPNERIFKIIDVNTAITDAFSLVNRNLVESLESLIELIYNPGIINIDFADLKAILAGRGNLAFLNTVEASGNDRAQKIIDGILHNPLYQHHHFQAEKVLFNITGGGSLSMMEVDRISKSILEQNPRAKIIFGISKEVSYKNKIKATLLMTGPSVTAAVPRTSVASNLPVAKLGQASAVLSKTKNVSVKEKKSVQSKSLKPVTKRIKKKSMPSVSRVGEAQPAVPVVSGLATSFSLGMPLSGEVRRLSVMKEEAGEKKAIRRNALDIKKAEELEESKRSQQEKEWEIPAFMRLKK